MTFANVDSGWFLSHSFIYVKNLWSSSQFSSHGGLYLVGGVIERLMKRLNKLTFRLFYPNDRIKIQGKNDGLLGIMGCSDKRAVVHV